MGELLKRKAEEGAKVVLLVWDEKLSTEGREGLMGTNDKETRSFFEGTKVRVQLVARQRDDGDVIEDQGLNSIQLRIFTKKLTKIFTKSPKKSCTKNSMNR